MADADEAKKQEAKHAQASEHAETIAALRARAEHQMSSPQRFVETLTASIGRPSTIGVLLAMIAVWIGINAFQDSRTADAIDPPPFFWLQGVVALYAALVSTFVLATQNREKRHGEQRAYLELQINLLAEQKTAKVISLLEELRRDLPSVRDRVDHQADAMQMPVDTAAVMTVLEETLDNPTDTELRISGDPVAPREPKR